MKTGLILLLLCPLLSFSQTLQIKVEAKPIDPKKGFGFSISKTANEIKIVYKTVDSIGKFSFSAEDKKIVNRLLAKQDIDSMSKDSILFFQQKLDAIKEANTFYKQDSTSVYSTTHKSYFQFLEMIVKTPDSVLAAAQKGVEIKDGTYCFFSIIEGRDNKKRAFYIENLDANTFPVPTKFVNDTEAIIRAHRKVMERKN